MSLIVFSSYCFRVKMAFAESRPVRVTELITNVWIITLADAVKVQQGR